MTRRPVNVSLTILLGFLFGGVPAWAQSAAEVVQKVGFDQRLDQRIPGHLSFRDHRNAPIRWGELFDGRPTIVALVYYRCPMLCTLELNGLFQSLQSVPLVPGREFNVAVVSFDPRETPQQASAKRRAYFEQFGYSLDDPGWHFLTGEQGSIEQLCEAVGFRYDYQAKTDLYAHASGLVVLTPEGRTARYFYGVDYPPRDIRLALVEASRGKIGSRIDQVLLLCYHYDPSTGRYSLAIMNLIRAACALTVLGIGGMVIVAVWRERRRHSPNSKARSALAQAGPT